MSEAISVSVIGPGALGSAVADLVEKHPHANLSSVWNRKQFDSFVSAVADNLSESSDKTSSSESSVGELIILTVPDDAISVVARQLSKTGISWQGRAVIHMSGLHGSSVLKPLSDVGAKTGSLHPLQTFNRGDRSERFDGIWFSMEGDKKLFPMFEALIKPTGARSKILTPDQKSGLHLAAVFASNYLVSLMTVVKQISAVHDIPDGIQMMEPIVRQTIANIISKGPENSLSGPAARGDKSTLEKHAHLMKDEPELLDLYCRLGSIAVDIAESNGRLDEKSAREIHTLFLKFQEPNE